MGKGWQKKEDETRKIIMIYEMSIFEESKYNYLILVYIFIIKIKRNCVYVCIMCSSNCFLEFFI